MAYTVEILPFALRAKGFNIFNFTISLALIFNQYVNPIALSHLGWRYYVSLYFSLSLYSADHLIDMQIVYACWLLFELGFLYLYVIETKGRTLEETAALFDGVDATELVTGSSGPDMAHHDSEKSIEKGSTSEVEHVESLPMV